MLKYRRAWLVGGWLLVGLVVYLSLTPHPPEPVSFPYVDKLEHGITYALLSLWFCQIYRSLRQGGMVVIALILMGVAIEFLQGWGGYRYLEYADMLANSAGVVLGFLLARTPLGHVFLWIERGCH